MRSFEDPDYRPRRPWKAKTPEEQREFEDRCARVAQQRAAQRAEDIAARKKLLADAAAGDKGAQLLLAMQQCAGNPNQNGIDGFRRDV